MKFSEYLSSFITPQMTLLEKFNAMCKYLELTSFDALYLHKVRIYDRLEFSFLDTNAKEYTIEELLDFDMRDKINIIVGGFCLVIRVSSGYNNTVTLHYIDGNGENASLTFNSNSIIQTQSVEKYEG